MTEAGSHGLLARFADSDQLLTVTTELRRHGYTHMDAYSPHPVEGLTAALGINDRRVPLIALVCAVVAGGAALALQVHASLDYPLNAGGKPIVSWPAYVIVTVAMSMIGATFGALGSMLLLNGFPRPYHPLFNIADFDAASRDGYFLCLQCDDPRFDGGHAETLLERHGAMRIWMVPA